MGLAFDEGFAGLSLGVKGVERLFEPLFRRLAGVDRAPFGRRHARGSRLRPKNLGPDQRVPVILVAISESELQVRPLQLYPSSNTVTLWVDPAHSRVRTVPGLGVISDGEFSVATVFA